VSKFMFFDFQCKSCNHTFEDFVKPDVIPPCPECQGETVRLVAAPTLDPRMESRHNLWVKQNRQKVQQDRKFYKDHGVDKKHHSYGS
jgi:putative FmdB family regulatory protein